MERTAQRTDLVADAWNATEAAASRAGVTIRDLTSLDQLRAAVDLFDQVWPGRGSEQVMPLGVIRAVSHAGSYVVGAYSVAGELVGSLVGFLGDKDGPLLHSHVLGVTPEARGGSVGYALKLHQRSWALARGIHSIYWTFDPLVSRNAYFNLTKLGAKAKTYYPNFYGRMDDSINAGEESDRLLVDWALASPNATAASNGGAAQPDIEAALSDGAVIALDEDADGRPVTGSLSAAASLVFRTPQDIVDLRSHSPEIASEWRQAQRAVLGGAIQDGFEVTGVSRSGWYLLARS